MRQRISKSRVEQLQPDDGDTFIWDLEVKGFGVRCRPSGAKFYVLKMRVGRRQRWITIGRHGSPWTPEKARGEALRLLGEKASGKDPAAERDKQKDVITIAELGQRFVQDYVTQRCKPRTKYEYRRSVELFITPALGKQRISDVQRPDVAKFHHEMREHPYQANHALAVFSKMMNLAEEWGLRSDGSNPCRHVKKYRENTRERYLTKEELDYLGRTLIARESAGSESPFAIAAIRLLVLTGARLSEILTLKWDHVDLENGVLRLPESKTGAKLVYLNAAAIELLRSMPRMETNDHVIAGAKTAAHLVELQKPWRRIRKAATVALWSDTNGAPAALVSRLAKVHGRAPTYDDCVAAARKEGVKLPTGLNDVRIHDLRHSFASIAAGAGLSLPLIGKLLGHSQPATTARYAHLADDPMRAAANLVGIQITAAMAPIVAQQTTTTRKRRVRLND